MHGYPFASTPFWSAIYTLPMLAGFLLMGPISGVLSDRFGQRLFTVGGMLIGAVGFIGLTLLPADFQPWQFFSMQVIVGIGLGMFSAPNTTAVMNAVPSHARGVASGMRATFQNVGMLLSMSIFFTMLTVGLAGNLPRALTSGLTAAGVPAPIAGQIGTLPPTAALFSAFLGYNPLGQLLPQSVLAVMSPSAQRQVLSTHFFPSLIMAPFMHGLSLAFYLSTSLALAAAVASYLCTDRQRKAPTTVSGEARAPIDVSMRPSLQPSPDDAVGKGRSIA
jgi:nitrate/nitrite transporter NarK